MSDYIFYGTASWEAPWLTEQNLAHALSRRGSRVLYIEPPISLATPFRPGRRNQLRRLGRLALRRADDVFLMQPIVVPPVTHPRARALSAPVMRARIRSAVARLGLERPVTVAARVPLNLRAIAGEELRIYLAKDWIQAGAGLLGRSQSELSGEVRVMAGWADVVCAISSRLQAGLRREGIGSVVLQHGFHAELAPLYDQAAEPPDLSSLPRPLLGFAGRIDDRLDVAVLVALAERFSQGTVVMVGPMSPRFPASARARLSEHSNIVMLGPRQRRELPAYLSSFDCSLIPYQRSEWSDYGSPLKLWDSLYAGPPIVGSGYLALTDYAPPLVRYAEGPEAFVSAVEDALSSDPSERDARREFALANSWDARAEELEAIVAANGARCSPARC